MFGLGSFRTTSASHTTPATPSYTMDANSQLQNRQTRATPPLTLNTAIKVVNLAKVVSGITPAAATCLCVLILLTLIRVRFSLPYRPVPASQRNQDFMANGTDYIEFGKACVDVCGTLSQIMNGKKLEDLSQAWHGAVAQLTTWVQPAIHDLDSSLTMLSTQYCGGYPGESRREHLPVYPCE